MKKKVYTVFIRSFIKFYDIKISFKCPHVETRNRRRSITVESSLDMQRKLDGEMKK